MIQLIAKELYAYLRRELSQVYPSGEATAVARRVLEERFGVPYREVITSGDRAVEVCTEDLRALVEPLKRHYPVQYLLGKAPFCGLEFLVNTSTLIPRPETEELVAWVVDAAGHESLAGRALRVLDIGTGSGCIAVTLAVQLKESEVFACDISHGALQVACENARRNGVAVRLFACDILSCDDLTILCAGASLEVDQRSALAGEAGCGGGGDASCDDRDSCDGDTACNEGRVCSGAVACEDGILLSKGVFCADMGRGTGRDGTLCGDRDSCDDQTACRDEVSCDGKIFEKLDIIISNPPYIRHSEKQFMQANVLDYEPHSALFVADDDPLLFYRKITELAARALNSGGRLFFEINEAFGQQTVAMVQSYGFEQVELRCDLFDKPRMLCALWR